VGIFLDSAGGLWVTDSERGQVQEWLTGESLFAGSLIGSYGTGNGQFNHSADVAFDGKGNLWALDKGNNRLEKFNEKGEFVSAVGTKGGGAGQLNAPSALAIDPSGNLWVTDTANNRIEEWNEAGQFVLTFGREVNKTKVETAGATEAEKNLCTAASGNVCQAGVVGSSNGQLKAPQGIAATSGGNLWITDTGNNRLKKFGPTGSLLNNFSSEGSEEGKVKEPTAIAMGPEGSIWVADSGNNRIEEWSSSLTFVRQFGSEGTGNSQFECPVALDIDSAGNVWVGDKGNDRVEQFTPTGEYVAQLGSSSRFAFSGPMGLAADNKGGLWVTDTDHNRVQRLLTSEFETPVVTQAPAIDYSYSGTALTEMKLKEPEAPDPSIAVTIASGLAASATTGAETAAYTYASGNLTAEKDSEGEVKYERDESNRITKVILPNGTWAKITYDSTGRATKVVVKPVGGTEKTTNFKYELSPRKTIVWGTEKPEVIYYIGEDGSVFRVENAATPPSLYEPKGSLWGHRNDPNPIENKDQTLFVTAESQNEIASIRVVANGNAVVEEETCEDLSKPPTGKCDQVDLAWIFDPAAFAAGRLDLEVIATDVNGHATSERFFVTIPQQPPPDPEADVPPDFASTKQFREDYGLDREHPLSKPELNKLVLELLYEWEAQLPTAMAAADTWGVPMRGPELAEMEYRTAYTNQAATLIPEWAEEHAASSYGGMYVDERAGGRIYVGFTANQGSLVEALRQSGQLMNPSMVYAFPVPPTQSMINTEELAASVAGALAGNTAAREATTSVSVANSQGVVEVGATNPTLVSEVLKTQLGASAPITVTSRQSPVLMASRYQTTGAVLAGSAIAGVEGCTAGWSARAPEPGSQGPPYLYFLLTAGHCSPKGSTIVRQSAPHESGPTIGTVKRYAWPAFTNQAVTDAEGVLMISPSLKSHSVLNGSPLEPQSIQGTEAPMLHHRVCWSGKTLNHHCGNILKAEEINADGRFDWGFLVSGPTAQGDSGGPVWDPETHKAVGLITAGSPDYEHNKLCALLPSNLVRCPRMIFTPLLPRPGKSQPPGISPTLGVEVLKEG
jgi:YD repeat-containing protein